MASKKASPKRAAAPKTKTSKAKRAKRPSGSEFLKLAKGAVKKQLSSAVDVPTFLSSTKILSSADRLLLVQQALAMLEGAYVHLPLKEAMHAVDPLQRLRLLHHRLTETAGQAASSDYEFHNELSEIFTSVRDLHTNYLLPAPFNQVVAFLPFQIEEYFENDQPRYVVTSVFQGFTHPTFGPGVEILHWNAVPIERAVELSAAKHAGSNPAARHTRGVAGLTIRPLIQQLPPDAEWVDIRYRTANGQELEFRQPWLVFQPGADAGAVDANAATSQATALGVDIEADVMRRATKVLFAPSVVEAEAKLARGKTKKAKKAAAQGLNSQMPAVFSARNVTTSLGTFGYIRIRTFNVDSDDDFIAEFLRLVEQLSQDGLIIDVRDNGGGLIYASERLLQLLTPRSIEPERTQFINTPLTRRLTSLHAPTPLPFDLDLSPWVDSIAQAVETGATYSRGFSITPVERANDIGQRYHGPVVLITNARCYSATDIFAAGFQDHEIGPILGTDDNTGAGGANVWTHELLEFLFRDPKKGFSKPLPDSPFSALPGGAGMRVSIRRTLRSGDQSGTPLEDLGVRPDHLHQMTRDDLLNGNRDLIERAAAILAGMPIFRLSAAVVPSAGDLVVTVTTQGLDRLDLYLDGRPQESLDVSDGATEVDLSDAGAASTLSLYGFKDGDLVAARNVSL